MRRGDPPLRADREQPQTLTDPSNPVHIAQAWALGAELRIEEAAALAQGELGKVEERNW